MNKRTKIWIGVGLGAMVLYLIVRPKLSMAAPSASPILGGAGNCVSGLKKCPNSDKTYCPDWNYIIDPCL